MLNPYLEKKSPSAFLFPSEFFKKVGKKWTNKGLWPRWTSHTWSKIFLQNTAEKSSEKDVTRYTETRAIDWANSPLRKTEVQPKGHQSRGTQRKSTWTLSKLWSIRFPWKVSKRFKEFETISENHFSSNS